METLDLIVSIIVVSITFISTVAGFIISLIKAIKNRRRANDAQVTNEIENLAIDKITTIEKIYSQASIVLKSMGLKTGKIKKENVMNYIESQCADKGIKFDNEYWSERIEDLVKIMNVNKE